MKPEETQIVPAPGQSVRRSFDSTELAVSGETSSSALVASARARVEARYIMAMRNPRDLDDVRADLLKECEREGFADKAWYRLPVAGAKPMEGFSIRFAEAAIRCMRNLDQSSPLIWEDANRRIFQVAVTDLEANVTYERTLVVEKTVERSSPRDGEGMTLSVRRNSQGKESFTVRATEKEMTGKENAWISATLRTLALRHIEGGTLDACEKLILKIRRGAQIQDPTKERKRLFDAFSKLGIKPSEIKEYLGHDIATASTAELEDLRDVYRAIEGGEFTWHDAVRAKSSGEEEAPPPTPDLGKVTEDLKAQRETEAAPKALTDPVAEECPHPDLPPSKMAKIPADETRTCTFCGEDVPGTKTAKGQRHFEE